MSLQKPLLHAQQIIRAHAATVQQKSSPGRAGRRLRKKKALESTSPAVTQPAIQLFQREIQWL
jgi:hypothetical protein